MQVLLFFKYIKDKYILSLFATLCRNTSAVENDRKEDNNRYLVQKDQINAYLWTENRRTIRVKKKLTRIAVCTFNLNMSVLTIFIRYSYWTVFYFGYCELCWWVVTENLQRNICWLNSGTKNVMYFPTFVLRNFRLQKARI